ncbi:MAG: transcriptional regulator NrdR [Polyangiaceae bacterium]|nr:transcriptional regulator NrdR [Polyangiaceae bacterium]
MKCPFCTAPDTKVTDSRASTNGDVIRRRRECEVCVRRFTTYERVEEVLPLVVKKDGRREVFDRQKVLGGLRRACDKRAVPLARLEETVDTLERELIDIGDKEISSKRLGELVMARLRAIDPVAYVRFASVYRQFRDIDELRTEIDRLAELAEQTDQTSGSSTRLARSVPVERRHGS